MNGQGSTGRSMYSRCSQKILVRFGRRDLNPQEIMRQFRRSMRYATGWSTMTSWTQIGLKALKFNHYDKEIKEIETSQLGLDRLKKKYKITTD